MAERKKLGLIFAHDENWIGGTYYILNLVHALNTGDDDLKPHIVVLSQTEKDFVLVKDTGYPYLSYRNPYSFKRSLPEKIVNRAYRTIFKKDIIDKRLTDQEIDFLFPAFESQAFEHIKNKIYWFPDFQHIRYPEYFNEEELKERNKTLFSIATGNQPLVLSSEAAKKDFEGAVSKYTCPVFVIPFAVTHPEYQQLDIKELRAQYGINKPYFMISNQFWKHKNHPVVLDAIAALKSKGHDFLYVFTGKEEDRRNPDYFPMIQQKIKEFGILDEIRLLGLIPREHQLALMKNAEAVIQPSFFEGWSTVVEDVKAMGQYIIVSAIPVHKEQLSNNCIFFNPAISNDLVEKLSIFIDQPKEKVQNNYTINKFAFGNQFRVLLESIN